MARIVLPAQQGHDEENGGKKVCAPVMTINEEVYGRLTVDEIDGIISKYEQMEGVQCA